MQVEMLENVFAADRVLLARGSTQELAAEVALDLVGTGRARWVSDPVGTPTPVSALTLATPAQVAASDPPVPAGALLADPITFRVYGISDGAGGYVPWDEASPADSAQFATRQQLLQVRSIPVSVTGQAWRGACAIVGVRAVTLGTGTLTIHDATAASDATLLRMSRAHSAMVAGTYYPLVSDGDCAALLCAIGAYVTIPSGGVYWLDVIDADPAPGAVGAGMLCAVARVTATGVLADAATGQALSDITVVSVKVLSPGSAGNLDIRAGITASDPLLYPSTAFGSLAADQIIKLGPAGGGVRVSNLYITVPTGGIVLVNHLPR